MKNYLLVLLCSFGLMACSTAKSATESVTDTAGDAVEATTDTMAEATEEVTETVEETTTMAKEEMGSPLPELTGDLSPMAANYAVMVSVDQGDSPMDMIYEIKEEGDLWSVSNSMESPMGAITDVCLLTKGTLANVKRSMSQGAQGGMDIAYDGMTVTGVIEGGPTTQEINAEIDGKVFCSGAALPFIVTKLPLAAGYSTALPIFDPGTSTRKNMMATVTAEESVEVEAGTFDAYKVDLTMEDGGPGEISLWVSKEDSPQLVKMMQTIPGMNGVMVSQLKAN